MTLRNLFLCSAVLSMALVSQASGQTGLDLLFNFGSPIGGTAGGAAGNAFEGLQYTGVSLDNAAASEDAPALINGALGGVVSDTTGAATGVSVTVDQNGGGIFDAFGFNINPNDGDPVFDATAGEFGNDVARSFFWALNNGTAGDPGEIHDVTISGLAAGAYDVDLLFGSNRTDSDQDVLLQGGTQGNFSETNSQTTPISLQAVVAADGILTIGIGQSDGDGGVSLLQAARINSAAIPEPGSLAMLACLGLGGLVRRRRRR